MSHMPRSRNNAFVMMVSRINSYSCAFCHVVSSINEEIGGPPCTVPRLAASLASMEVPVVLVTLDYAEHGPQHSPNNASLCSKSHECTYTAAPGWSPSLRREIVAIAIKARG